MTYRNTKVVSISPDRKRAAGSHVLFNRAAPEGGIDVVCVLHRRMDIDRHRWLGRCGLGIASQIIAEKTRRALS